MTWAVVRVRGSIHASHENVQETLRHLHLTRPNHVVILKDAPQQAGMIYRVQGYVTWGPVSSETVELLVKNRGATPEGKPFDDAQAKALAPKILKEGTSALKGEIKPLFRLKAPKGGWRSTKKTFARGGALGFRPAKSRDNIDALIKRMI